MVFEGGRWGAVNAKNLCSRGGARYRWVNPPLPGGIPPYVADIIELFITTLLYPALVLRLPMLVLLHE